MNIHLSSTKMGLSFSACFRKAGNSLRTDSSAWHGAVGSYIRKGPGHQCCQLSGFSVKSGGFQCRVDGKFFHLAASGKSRGFDNFYGGNLADFKKIASKKKYSSIRDKIWNSVQISC